MTQPEAKPSPPFGMENCPACGAYVLQGWPIRRIPAISPEDLEVIRSAAQFIGERRDSIRRTVDQAYEFTKHKAALTAMIDKWEGA